MRPELGENEMGDDIIHYFRVDSTNNVAAETGGEG